MKKWTDDELINIVKLSYSIGEVLKKLKMKDRIGSYQIIKLAIVRLRINTDHFKKDIETKIK